MSLDLFEEDIELDYLEYLLDDDEDDFYDEDVDDEEWDDEEWDIFLGK